MRYLAFLGACLLILGVSVGCSESSGSYSNELSKEVPKPRAEGPDFGAFKPAHPLNGGGGKAGGK